MATARSITKFENSLKEFLVNAMADKYGDAHSYAYRYNNLKVVPWELFLDGGQKIIQYLPLPFRV